MELEAVQASINVALSRSIMDMQANMASQIINGSSAGLATQTDPARAAGLAGEGIGTRVDTVA